MRPLFRISISSIIVLAILTTVSCKEEEAHPNIMRVEITLHENIDSASFRLTHPITSDPVRMTIENGIAFAEFQGDHDCVDVEVSLYKRISETGWVTQVSEVNTRIVTNLLPGSVTRIASPAQEPAPWKSFHWFHTPAFGGITSKVPVNTCEQEIIITINNTQVKPTYILYQHCGYAEQLLIDCAIQECADCENKFSGKLPVYGLQSWCDDTSLRHDYLTYMLIKAAAQTHEVMLGYF